MRRLYRDVDPSIENTRWNTDAEKAAAQQFARRKKERASGEVTQAMSKNLTGLSDEVDALRDRYAEHGNAAKKLMKQMESGELTYDDAGAQVDQLRSHLERLDSVPPSLYSREDRIADAMEDPLGFLDEMYERARSLRRPEYPW